MRQISNYLRSEEEAERIVTALQNTYPVVTGLSQSWGLTEWHTVTQYVKLFLVTVF